MSRRSASVSEDAASGAEEAFRTVSVPHVDKEKYPSNLLITSKYTALNFLPLALGEQYVARVRQA